MMLLLIIVPPAQGKVLGIDESILDIIGLVAMILGEALRVGVVGLKYIVRGGKDKKVYANELVTGGFFTVCRNPLYVGNILIAVGALMIHAQPVLMLAGIALTLFIYVAIVASEENFLRGKFGDAYEAYCKDVNRWFPNLARLPAASAGMAFNVKRVMTKEYPTVAGTVAGIVILLGNEAWKASGALPVNWLIALGVVVVATLAIRGAKKAGAFKN